MFSDWSVVASTAVNVGTSTENCVESVRKVWFWMGLRKDGVSDE